MIVYLSAFSVEGDIRETRKGFSVLINQHGSRCLVFSRSREVIEQFLTEPTETPVTVRGRIWKTEAGVTVAGLKFILD